VSASPTLVTRRHFDYIAERTAREDDLLRELKVEAKAAGIPAIQISAAQGSLMHILLKAIGAKSVVEVGTLAGYSAIWMARALPPGGRVRTIELKPRHADFAEAWIAKAGLSDKVQVLRGRGMDVLPSIESESADAAFLDADKRSYPAYLKECMRIVRPGGLILADNAFAFGELFDENPEDPETPAIREFNDLMAGMEGLRSIIVPIGDGLWVGLRE
jgi:predicted O-methyltransferase YrrM